MHDARQAAKARAASARESAAKLTEQLDRERREFYAARADRSLTAPDLNALEDLIKVDQLRMVHASHVAELLDEISKGRRVLT